MGRTDKEPVRLRRKKLKDGNESLYLDIYIRGIRSYEFLKLYLIKENTKQDRERNRHTLQLANAIKAKRIVEIQNEEYGFGRVKDGDIFFLDYFRMKCEEKKDEMSASTALQWGTMLKHLENYIGTSPVRIKDIDARWVEGLKKYLEDNIGLVGEKKLRQNTRVLYFTLFRTAMNDAFRENLIRTNPCTNVRNFKEEDSGRMYLTIDELRTLSNTPCGDDMIRRMFLFSALSGLRWSDVIRLRWSDVHDGERLTRIIFRQKKTKGNEYLDITGQAAELLGKRGGDDELIFEYRHSRVHLNSVIDRWVKKAGITKHITFHCARHTFATMMLDIGTDIYTVSKLLGHRELTTTQIYAKIMDKNKQRAVENIPDIL